MGQDVSDRPAPEAAGDGDGDDIVERIFGPSAGADPRAPGEFRSGFVALVGRPNVGKSTLLNAILGEKIAIVTPRPQTTRRRILGIHTTPAAQAIFVDTPGIHRPRHSLGRSMVRAAKSAIPEADVVVWVVDVSVPPDSLDRTVAGLVRRAGVPVLLALNKSDRLRPEDLERRIAEYTALAGEPAGWMLTIATRGHNLDRLWAQIVAVLPPGPLLFPEDQLTDQTDRMLASELVREAALTYLREEIPHGMEVVVDEWSVRDDGLLTIRAQVLVERESHKPIVIGRGGSMLERIGIAARRSIEALVERKVFLDLNVTVREDWRRKAGAVKRLGYE